MSDLFIWEYMILNLITLQGRQLDFNSGVTAYCTEIGNFKSPSTTRVAIIFKLGGIMVLITEKMQFLTRRTTYMDHFDNPTN
jgi:hypothetical protein